MLPAFLPVLLMAALALALAVGLAVASWLLGKVRQSRTQLMPYECGLDPMDEPFRRVYVRYYVVALLFLLFDVETLFLFPVAAVYRERVAAGWGLYVYGELAIFLAILLAGYVYVVKKGALRWQ